MTWLPADLAAFRAAAGGLKTRRNRSLWARDPVAWLHDRLHERAWSKQQEILHSVAGEPRTAAQSCHGVGKSRIASRAGLWWCDTAENPEDRFLVTTAPTTAQVRAILWRYMRQGHREHKLVGTILQNAEWKSDDGELIGYGRKPADTDESAFQGIHAPDGVLTVVDEAGGVPHQLFVAADALATNDASRQLVIGNPDDNTSHFATICQRERGWNVIKISAFDSPNLTGEQVPDRMAQGLVSEWWVRDKQLRWGEQNPLYIAKVLGEFADSEDGLIPLSWVTAANQRWREWQETRRASPVLIEPPGRRVFAMDVAWRGEDKTAIAQRQGDIINPDGEEKIETYAKLDTIATTEKLTAHMDRHAQARAAVDVGGGWGAHALDKLTRDGYEVFGFNGSKPTKRKDITGLLRFSTVRSASWWNLRELLDPSAGATLALPPDDDLTADLTTPKYDQRTGGVIVVEEKDDIKKRLGHSPDVGDAVVIACWSEGLERGADRELSERRADAPPLEHADAYDPSPDYVYPSGDIAALGHGDEVWL